MVKFFSNYIASEILVPCDSSPLSESASVVGAGPAVPAAQAGCLSLAEVFKLAVTNFKVHDWGLFNTGA